MTTEKEVLDWLQNAADPQHLAGLPRFGIPTARALGVPMGEIKAAAKRFRPAHGVIHALWDTGLYEARVMAVHLADPARFSRKEADAWCADFDNWALCDTASFHLFDRPPFRWEAARDWVQDARTYVRRAGFATLWGLSVHDKSAKDALFVEALSWARAAADDARDPVRKAVDMSVRAIGKRNAVLNRAALDLADELVLADDQTPRWLGRHIRRELSSERVLKRVGLSH